MAVILDNLDDDEDKKRQKLQQVFNKKTTRRVPPHLELLKFCGPKLISAPKLVSAASDNIPNLTEADVKSFYEAGENRELREELYLPQQVGPSMGGGTLQRHGSDLSQLQLLTVDSSNMDSVSSYHNKYHGEGGKC